jgi:hypothetical protein
MVKKKKIAKKKSAPKAKKKKNSSVKKPLKVKTPVVVKSQPPKGAIQELEAAGVKLSPLEKFALGFLTRVCDNLGKK